MTGSGQTHSSFLEQLENQERSEQLAAIQYLSRHPDADALAKLASLLLHNDPELREPAREALVDVADRTVIVSLARQLDEEMSADDQQRIAETLLTASGRLTQPLAEMITKSQTEKCLRVVIRTGTNQLKLRALEELREPDVSIGFPVLLDALQDSTTEVVNKAKSILTASSQTLFRL
jgi:HEAT repeat protein